MGVMRLTVKGTVRGVVIITVKEMLIITVTDMVRINGKYIVRCMVIITVTGTVTHTYLYLLCAPVTLLFSTTNSAAYRRCLHSNVSRHVRVERLTPNCQLFLIVPSSPYHLKLAILSVFSLYPSIYSPTF